VKKVIAPAENQNAGNELADWGRWRGSNRDQKKISPSTLIGTNTKEVLDGRNPRGTDVWVGFLERVTDRASGNTNVSFIVIWSVRNSY